MSNLFNARAAKSSMGSKSTKLDIGVHEGVSIKLPEFNVTEKYLQFNYEKDGKETHMRLYFPDGDTSRYGGQEGYDNEVTRRIQHITLHVEACAGDAALDQLNGANFMEFAGKAVELIKSNVNGKVDLFLHLDKALKYANFPYYASDDYIKAHAENEPTKVIPSAYAMKNRMTRPAAPASDAPLTSSTPTGAGEFKGFVNN
jgi:hypothetical protein